MRHLRARIRACRRGDRGSQSIEYAMLIGIGLTFGAVLLKVLTAQSTFDALSRLVGRALG